MLPEYIKKLLRPEAYPHPVTQLRVIQTHISFVLLTGHFAYKIKKPIDLGFLDFTTLEKRKYCCEREVVLNKRLAPTIYERVVSINSTETGDISIEGPGAVVEYAVKMHEMPQDRMMNKLIPQGLITEDIMERLVRKLVPFYERAATGPEIDSFGDIEHIRYNLEENFRQTENYIGRALSRECFQNIRNYSLSMLDEKADLFQNRIKLNRIRDGHGDLYSANICVSDGIYIYDCIEFNDRFRYADVASDISFLAMDLDFHGLSRLSGYFVNRFIEMSGDYLLEDVLNFYKCYRACVRGKVHSFSADSKDMEEEERESSMKTSRSYFGLAHEYTGGPGKPVLWVFFGPIAGGKSSLSRNLGTKLHVDTLNSDRIRKALAGLQPTDKRPESWGQGIYSKEFSELTYSKMIEEAETRLRKGETVILDASFSKKVYREKIIKLAESMSVPYFFVYCYCSEEETKRRLDKRAGNAQAVSDGRWEIYVEQVRLFEPPDEIADEQLINIATDQPKEKVWAGFMKTFPRFC